MFIGPALFISHQDARDEGSRSFMIKGGEAVIFYMRSILTICITLMMMPFTTLACTDFKLTAKDGTVLITRSMEFALDLKSNLRNSNRGRKFTTTTPDNKPGIAWTAKYGYVFLDGLNHDMTVDGMNEVGLSFEYLYLPGETQYQAIPPGKESQSLPYMHLGDWILSSFKTVDEVRKALSDIYVYQEFLPGLGNMVFPLHASIFDASGKGIVVEFVKGKTLIYDNIGVMTNAPLYDWHVTNLRNFVNLSPFNPTPVIANGLTFAATGQGSGMVGLPGDISPPSRFVKISVMANTAYPATNALGVLNLAEHIINNVDIPLGISRAMDHGKVSTELTQWVVFKDLTHKMLYYRTYENMSLRAISLDKLDFTENAPRYKMPIAAPSNIENMNVKMTTAKEIP